MQESQAAGYFFASQRFAQNGNAKNKIGGFYEMMLKQNEPPALSRGGSFCFKSTENQSFLMAIAWNILPVLLSKATT